jgi:proline racemase
MVFHLNPEIFLGRFSGQITTIDSHTAGEATRLIVGGIPPLQGDTTSQQRLAFIRKYDHVRRLLCSEPRGHRDMLAALVTPAVTPGAQFGLIYMDARRYPYLCGHATIGAVTTLIEAGLLSLSQPEACVQIDTPSGVIKARATVEAGKVVSVTLQMAPAFVYKVKQPLEVPSLGWIEVDLVCEGGFFAMVSADQIGIPLKAPYASQLADLGMAIIAAANKQIEVSDPSRPEVDTVDVAEFYTLPGQSCHGAGVVVYGESHVDRSPCGTGTSAKLALLYHLGLLQLDQAYTNQGILGTTFEGRLIGETKVGDLPAVIPEVTGSAHITGLHQFVLDADDPFPEGYLLG